MFWYRPGMADSRSLSERLAKLPPGRHLVPRDFVAQNQRERMLLATAELVAERGYQKTTIELIAKTARVALSTFYEQFSSKEDCFLAAFDETVAGAAEVFDELIDQEESWVEQISSGIEIFLEMIVNEPARARLCIVEAQAAGGARGGTACPRGDRDDVPGTQRSGPHRGTPLPARRGHRGERPRAHARG